jgi:hypothetical protein
MTDISRELSWDDEIQHDSPDFVILPEGDYDFEVVEFERARHAGSENLPPCNKAIVHIKIEAEEGISVIRHQLFLHTKTEGLLANFFMGIGQRKKGEKISMNWNKVVGATGRARVGIREWDGKNYNEIKRFYEPEEPAKFQPGKF